MNDSLRQPGPRHDALIQLLRTAETLWNGSRVFFARWELSPSQFNILNVLLDTPAGRTQVDLSRELLMHRSNVTGLVDRLERRKLVLRRPLPGDRRAYLVALTPAGKRLVAQILPHYYQAADQVWGGFPTTDLPPLMDALQRIATNVEHLASTQTA